MATVNYQEAMERRLRRKERVKKLKELYGPSAKQWMKRKVCVCLHVPCDTLIEQSSGASFVQQSINRDTKYGLKRWS